MLIDLVKIPLANNIVRMVIKTAVLPIEEIIIVVTKLRAKVNSLVKTI